MKNTMVYLIGFPGTGKYTVAQELAARAGFRLVDNHLVNNAVFSLIHADGKTPLPPGVWDYVDRIWAVVFDTLTDLSPAEGSFVLTNVLFEDNPEDRAHYEKIAAVAERRGALFVPVRMVIGDVGEHARRISAPGRAARFKETDAEAPRRYAAEKEVMRVDHPHALTLDVSGLPAADAADAILAHARGI